MKSVTRIDKPNSNADVGERIKYLRCNSLLSQTDLANKLGRKREEITMYETGARNIDINTLKEVAKIFNVSTDYLLGITEFESIDTNNIAIHNLLGLSDEAIKNLIRLKKYHNSNILDTINYLLEQEKLFPDEYYTIIENVGSLTDEEVSKAINVFYKKKYKKIFSSISNYFNVKIDSNDKIHIFTKSMKMEKNIDNLYDRATTKDIISCEDVANTYLLKQIEDKLISAKQEYLNKTNNDEEL